MSIGYACKLIGVEDTEMKSCTMKNATEERLLTLIEGNLKALDRIIDYNIQNRIKMFRISSDLIPFGSSPVNSIKWWELYAEQFEAIGQKIKDSGMRVSLHPGQYTVINSPSEDVVLRAVDDLVYHARILDAMTLSTEHKLILHIGGAYGDKPSAMERFCDSYEKLPEAVKKRLIIENDDKIYTIDEVLAISLKMGIPVVYDNLHHEINHGEPAYDDAYWIAQTKTTWKPIDGKQKVHYSQQAVGKKTGSHSDFIHIVPFMAYYHAVSGDDIDIMLEVKDKNLSCVKCVHCTDKEIEIKHLEKAWSRYKYSVLERSQAHYLGIRKLFNDHREALSGGKISTEAMAILSYDFYRMVDDALTLNITHGSAVNALSHVWGYFKNLASESEKANFMKQLKDFEDQSVLELNLEERLYAIKRNLEKLARKYKLDYLLQSYYFNAIKLSKGV